jgi:hypothetical protein
MRKVLRKIGIALVIGTLVALPVLTAFAGDGGGYAPITPHCTHSTHCR